MPHLSARNYPIIANTTKISYTHPFSKHSCTFVCTQVPIVPAYAVTAHRAQGQSMERVIIDLESCQGMEAPYVMASRATSLDGLLILRPFQQKRITCALSQDARTEKSRLHQLSLETMVKFGDTDKSKQAQLALSRSQNCPTVEMGFVQHSDQPKEPFALLQHLQKQDLRIYEAPLSHASSQNLNHQIIDHGSTEPSVDFLIPSGNFNYCEPIHNLHYLRNITADEEVSENRPTVRIHKKPYLKAVPSSNENTIDTNNERPANVQDGVHGTHYHVHVSFNSITLY
jgi:hypothetical protein